MTTSWKDQEKRLAKVTGGSRNAGSGAFSRKGDIRTKNTVWEMKWTGKKQFTVKSEVLEKVFREAVVEDRLPVVGFELNGRNYAMLEENDLLELIWKAGLE